MHIQLIEMSVVRKISKFAFGNMTQGKDMLILYELDYQHLIDDCKKLQTDF